MIRWRARLTLAFLAVAGATLLVSGGSAGNRTAQVTFQALPGDSVTYGETFKTTTSITNLGSSMFTHVEVHHKIPTTGATNGSASFVTASDASCAPVVDEVVCSWDQLQSKGTQTVTFVWQAPPSGTGCVTCLSVGQSYWLIKEGKPTNLNEQFPFFDPPAVPFAATLLGGDGSTEKKKAAGFETQGVGTEPENCSAGAGNLHTNSIGLTNADPVASTLCLPNFDGTGSFAFGYSAGISETSNQPTKGLHKELGQSKVCVAATGQSCIDGVSSGESVNWGDERARQIFSILESALKGSQTITKVYHNGKELPPCDGPNGDPDFPQGCVVAIIPPADGSNPRIWTVIADAPTNGPWNW